MVLGVSRLKSEYLDFPVISEAHPTVEASRVAIAQPTTWQHPRHEPPWGHMNLDQANLSNGLGRVSLDLVLWMVRKCRPPEGQAIKLDWHMIGQSGASSNFSMVGLQLGAMISNE